MPLTLYRRPGRRHWYVRGTVNGMVANESCRTDDPTRAAAYLDRLSAELWDRSLVSRRDGLSFRAAALQYAVGKSEPDRRLIDRLVAAIGHLNVAQIDQAEADALAARLGPHLSAASRVRSVYTPLAAVLHFAAQRGACPWIRLGRPRIDATPRDRVLSPAEAKRLLAGFRGDGARVVALFMILTGARVGEALAIRWEDLDLKRGHASITEFKTRRRRGIALAPQLVAALANLAGRGERAGRVFRWTSRRAYLTHWHAALVAAGLGRDVSPHTCRHTFATWARSYGEVDLRGLMEAGGWRDPKSVARYAHVTSAETRALAGALPKIAPVGRK